MPRQKVFTETDLAHIANDLEKGLTMGQIAKKNGITHNTLRLALLNCGYRVITTRKVVIDYKLVPVERIPVKKV